MGLPAEHKDSAYFCSRTVFPLERIKGPLLGPPDSAQLDSAQRGVVCWFPFLLFFAKRE